MTDRVKESISKIEKMELEFGKLVKELKSNINNIPLSDDPHAILIPSETVIKWINAIRNSPTPEQQYRMLENFWGSQIRSKAWLINALKSHFPEIIGNIYIFGGWYGVLAEFLNIGVKFSKNIYSIDSDFECIKYGYEVVSNSQKIIFKAGRMENFTDYKDPGLIINTSTEHITNEVYKEWLENLPHDVPIILQGNNLFDCEDHIRCSATLEEFNEINPLKRVIFTDELICDYHFKRFMTMGFANG